MSTVKAIIRKNKVNSKGECVVYLRYLHDEKAVDFSTGIKVKISDWSESKERINSTRLISKSKKAEELQRYTENQDKLNNLLIDTEKARISDLVREAVSKDIPPTTSYIKEKYQTKHIEQKVSRSEVVDVLFEKFIEVTPVSYNTKKTYRTALGHLRQFEKTKKTTLHVQDITLHFFEKYHPFLLFEIPNKAGGNGLSTNSVWVSVKNLKVFLRYLEDHGYKLRLKISDLQVEEEPSKILFLTERELEQLMEFDLSQNERLERVRDLFVFNCFTGLRFSDLSRLRVDVHVTDNAVDMRALKNQKDVFVPLTKIPLRILDKYGNQLPSISEQKFNDYLKELGKLAGLKNRVEITNVKSGNKTLKTYEKWETISSHMAIRTFITLCGKKGIPVKTVSEITGKSVNVILKHYYGTDREAIRKDMERAFG